MTPTPTIYLIHTTIHHADLCECITGLIGGVNSSRRGVIRTNNPVIYNADKKRCMYGANPRKCTTGLFGRVGGGGGIRTNIPVIYNAI